VVAAHIGYERAHTAAVTVASCFGADTMVAASNAVHGRPATGISMVGDECALTIPLVTDDSGPMSR